MIIEGGVDWKLAVDVIWKIGTVIVLFWAVISNKSKANKDAIDVLSENHKKDMDNLKDRQARLEGVIHGLPTHDDLAKMHDKINAVKDDTSGLVGTLSGISKNVGLLMRHHIGEKQ